MPKLFYIFNLVYLLFLRGRTEVKRDEWREGRWDRRLSASHQLSLRLTDWRMNKKNFYLIFPRSGSHSRSIKHK